MIFMLDNYDSFTFNLVQYIRAMNDDVLVKRNDELTTSDVVALRPEAIVISPGPCSPSEAGISVELIRCAAENSIPLLGICLGMQSLGQAFGGRIVHAAHIMHGKVSDIQHNGQGLFSGIKSPMKATRYHSLAVKRASLPSCLEITATTEDGEIMALRHRALPIAGVQFHPESILTSSGKRLLRNFLTDAGVLLSESH